MPVRDKAYSRLQHDVCVRMGFCGAVIDGKPSHVDFFIPDSGPVTADQFIEWLFKAEGYYPDHDPKCTPHYATLRSLFIENMGSEVVDASKLKWDD